MTGVQTYRLSLCLINTLAAPGCQDSQVISWSVRLYDSNKGVFAVSCEGSKVLGQFADEHKVTNGYRK